MTEDLTDGAFAILELLAIPVLVPVALGLAAWRWLRKPPRVDLPIAPTAHRGAELGKLAEDHRKDRTIKNGELYLAARARKAQEDDRCDARAMEAVQAMAPPDPAAAEQGEREGVPRRDRGAGGQAMTPEHIERLMHGVSGALDEMGQRWPDEAPMAEWSAAFRRAWDAIDALVREAENEALERAAAICDGRADGWTGRDMDHRDALLLRASERIRSLKHPSPQEDRKP